MSNQTITRCLLALASLLPLFAHATHNRAGEIHLEQIGPLRLRAKIITWTKASSTGVDRDSLTICWGDGTCQKIARTNGGGNGVVLPNDIKYNEYVWEHTFPGPATYTISMNDQNRIIGIINVNPPASENIAFHISTTYTFQDPQFDGSNTTPYLKQPPIDNACVGRPFKHNPNAYDIDDDSLSYELIVPLQDNGSPVPNYSFPNQIGPGPKNQLTLDPVTGELLWANPQIPGDYNIAIIVISWRNGVPIDTTIRDMQINVDKCDNYPPVVMAETKICVVAGTTVAFEVTADDPDTTDLVQLTAIGAPLESPFSPATFTAPTGFVEPIVKGQFSWVTACEHISNQPYSVVFKAVDSVSSQVPKLVDLKTTTIKVVGPAPEDVQAISAQGEVEITWANPYVCEGAANNYFYGFSVWRKEGSNPFVPDTCMPGLAGRGYTELTFATRDIKDGRYYFKDTQVQRGRTYCYRVLAKFARLSAGGYPYNIVESLPSQEVCVQLPRDLPLITNVSIEATSMDNGIVQVCWSKPDQQDLDTIQNPGPYRYQLLRSTGFSGGALIPVPGASFSAAQFWQANDTCFTDTGLNTSGTPYHYEVAFYVKGQDEPLGNTNPASSIFLNIASTDNKNNLTWKEEVPWGNYNYEVYRLNNNTGQFVLLGTTTTPRYSDVGLTNGISYCYKIKSIGTYRVGGVIDPILNWSQENCGTPLDTIPPCPPVLTVTNRCNTGEALEIPDPPFENRLNWTNPNVTCGSDDVVLYRVWYASAMNSPYELVTEVEGAANLQYIHSLPDALAGCYAVSAVDSLGNESARSQAVCVDNCPLYELPNAFTPNGDEANDVFKPFPNWRFVERVEIQIFNRWGALVFETTDPAINWAGTTKDGKELADGTYFYVCKVFEQRVEGIVQRPDVLSGYIELLRNR